MLAHPKLATVLFDEAHSEAWTIRPEIASRIQPAHPADSSFTRAATALATREFEIRAHTDGPLDREALAGAAVLVIAHPSEPKWEATVDGGSPRLSDAEIDAIEAFVSDGGGLLVLGETEEDKYGANLNQLVARFGIEIVNATVQDYEHHHAGAPSWILATLDGDGAAEAGADPLAGVAAVCFYRAGALSADNGAQVIARAHDSASVPRAPLAATARHGAGRVAVLADSDLFGDDCIGDLDHERLWLNLVHWAAEPSFAGAEPPAASEAAADPAWPRLRDAVAELRIKQPPDGSIDTDAHVPETLRALVATIVESVLELKPRFGHQHDYIDALAADLLAWSDTGFGKPGFDRSTEAFRPERSRRDGIEHLCVFPMYKQNASRDTCFEALIVRVPWPEWIAEIERGGYDNAKYVPVTLVDYTAGYDSECAVLF